MMGIFKLNTGQRVLAIAHFSVADIFDIPMAKLLIIRDISTIHRRGNNY